MNSGQKALNSGIQAGLLRLNLNKQEELSRNAHGLCRYFLDATCPACSDRYIERLWEDKK